MMDHAVLIQKYPSMKDTSMLALLYYIEWLGELISVQNEHFQQLVTLAKRYRRGNVSSVKIIMFLLDHVLNLIKEDSSSLDQRHVPAHIQHYLTLMPS